MKIMTTAMWTAAVLLLVLHAVPSTARPVVPLRDYVCKGGEIISRASASFVPSRLPGRLPRTMTTAKAVCPSSCFRFLVPMPDDHGRVHPGATSQSVLLTAEPSNPSLNYPIAIAELLIDFMLQPGKGFGKADPPPGLSKPGGGGKRDRAAGNIEAEVPSSPASSTPTNPEVTAKPCPLQMIS